MAAVMVVVVVVVVFRPDVAEGSEGRVVLQLLLFFYSIKLGIPDRHTHTHAHILTHCTRKE